MMEKNALNGIPSKTPSRKVTKSKS